MVFKMVRLMNTLKYTKIQNILGHYCKPFIFDVGLSAYKTKTANQDKGFKAEFEAFKSAVKSGEAAISFESIYNTTKMTFKILESIRSGNVVKI